MKKIPNFELPHKWQCSLLKQDISIAALADAIKEIVGFKGAIAYDTDKPDGTPRKLLDVSRLAKLGWQSKIDLQKGIAATYEWYLREGAI